VTVRVALPATSSHWDSAIAELSPSPLRRKDLLGVGWVGSRLICTRVDYLWAVTDETPHRAQ